MKHLILIIGIISSILQACQLTEVDGYVGGSSIYFSIQRDTMTYSWGTVDSDIQERVLELPIYLFGEVKDYDRQVKVKVAETNATVDVDYKALADSYTIPAGNTFGAILVELLRPEILKKEERYIILELEENNDFALSYPTKVTSSNDEGYSAIRYRIYFSEIMTPPLKWSIPEFGEFSVKKLDFMCTEMNMTRDMFNDPEYMLASRQQYVGAKMVQILDEYSANGNPIYEDDNVTLMKMGDKYYK